MSSTLLEVTRASHEEVKRLERLAVKELQTKPTSNKDRLYQSHRVRFMIDQIVTTTRKLVEIYEDADGARKDEIAALGGQTATGTNVLSVFYDRVKGVSSEFEEEWGNGNVQGWEKEGQKNGNIPSQLKLSL